MPGRGWRGPGENAPTSLRWVLRDDHLSGGRSGRRAGATARDASQEAKDAWKKLEPRIGEAEAKLRGATDEAARQLEGMVGELKNSLSNLRDKL